MRLSESRKDHPRTRGEKEVFAEKYPEGEGSPPHARGKAALPASELLLARITPARAGKSEVTINGVTYRKDHPRTRGEKPRIDPETPIPEGSPPHARGKVPKPLVGLSYGKDHPRTRGEKF